MKKKGMPGHVIKKYREIRDFSQKYVAAKMGISQNAYSKIENGITQLTVHHVKELARILDVPVTDLLRDEFVIHKPAPISPNISRTELLQLADALLRTIASKHANRHHSYLTVASLLQAAENALHPVH